MRRHKRIHGEDPLKNNDLLPPSLRHTWRCSPYHFRASQHPGSHPPVRDAAGGIRKRDSIDWAYRRRDTRKRGPHLHRSRRPRCSREDRFYLGAFACFFGIFVGDVLLFFAGRYLGRPALKRAPLKWFISSEDVEKSSAWFSRSGLAVIFASRFVPGARLPTYFAAGLFNTRFWWFALYFLLAGASGRRCLSACPVCWAQRSLSLRCCRAGWSSKAAAALSFSRRREADNGAIDL